MLSPLLAIPAVLFAAGSGHAQVPYFVGEPVFTYQYGAPPAAAVPATSYYYAPTTSYYAAPAAVPATSYYAAPVAVPAVSYYAAPVVPATTYYAPAVSYYAPAVSYYAPSATVTTYRYGILPRRRVTVTNYYSPVLVTP
jgi:hypothetical protein